jgi:hypothetical protein
LSDRKLKPLPPDPFRHQNLAIAPGEDPAAFEKLYQDLIAELQPDGPSENETVATIARLMWRKQNLETFRIAEGCA